MAFDLFLNALFVGSFVTMIGLGFALIFRTTHFFHFAHAILFTTGAYLVFLLRVEAHMPTALAVVCALLGTATLGCLIEGFIYRPLRSRRASPLILLLASLGLYIVLQNAISVIFGDDTKIVRCAGARYSIHILGAHLTAVQLTTIFVSVILLLTVTVLLKRTRIGQSIRAVASDSTLADVSGIDSNRVILVIMAIGSLLAAAAGILVAFDVDMTPTMGMQPFMLATVATIAGGVRNVWLIALASLLLASAQQIIAWQIGSHWQECAAFIVLVAFLLTKPKGLQEAKA